MRAFDSITSQVFHLVAENLFLATSTLGKKSMTVLRQLSDRNLRIRTFDPRHVTLVCLLLLLVIWFGLLYEVKPSSLKNHHREVSPSGRKELRLRDAGQASRSERIEEKEERAGGKRVEIDKLRESKVDEEDSEVGDDERDVVSDGEIEEEEELEAMDDLVDEEEEEWEEEEEDGERVRDVMTKANRSSN